MKYIENATKFFFFAYVFFLTTTLSNAGRSITMVGLIVFLLFLLMRSGDASKQDLLPEKSYLIIYAIFFGLLILASFFALTKTAISNTLKYLYWTLPFWLIYFSNLFFSVHRLWCNAVSLAMIVLGMFTIVQFCHEPLGTRLSGIFSSPNGLAEILELCLPYIILYTKYCREQKLPKREFYFNLIAALIVLFSLLFTQSRGGIAGVIIGITALFIVKLYFKKWATIFVKKVALIVIGLIFIGGTILSGFIVFQRNYDNERLLMIESSYHMWEDHKLWGVGIDNWKAEYKNYISPLAKEPDVPMPHNNIAYFFSTTGVVGGLGYCTYVLGTLYILVRRLKNNPCNIYYAATFWAFLSIVIHSMVDLGIDGKYQMQILSSGLGIALSCLNKKDKA